MSRERRAENHDADATSGSQSGSKPDPQIGQVLEGRYRLTARIARGGMATVYEALDQRLDRVVAVKVMHSGMGSDPAYAARFVREARAAARLDHPNVVQIFDQGDDNGTLFLVMELVRGVTLRDQMRPGVPLDPDRALDACEKIVSALAAAHSAGLIHRDIKPENVLIGTDGRIKVADFGLARAVTAETQHTSTGVLIGTVSYIAPEIVTDGRADQRSDVYSVGVMTYEMLTGRKPHEGESPIQVAYKHVHADIPAPSLLAPGLPSYVDALVAGATARDPFERPADARVLLQGLRRVIAARQAGRTEDPALVAALTPQARPDAEATIVEALPRLAPDSQSTVQAEPTTTRQRTAEVGYRDPLPAIPPTRERARRGPLWVAVAVLLVAALAGSAWWFGYGRYTSTPGVLGVSQDSAIADLEAAGLTVEITEPVWSETVAEAMVVSTDPAAGERILNGGRVELTLSKGPEIYALPKLAGMTLKDAKDALKPVKMSAGKVTNEWSEEIAKGTVMRTDPKAGVELAPGSSIDLWVSKGRQPIEVTSWVGKSGSSATAALEKAGLKVTTSQSYSDSVTKGDVISQSPKSGTLYRGDTVALELSRGPEMVEIPGGLRASGVAEATKKLEALGFKVETKKTALYLGLGYVSSITPGSGKKAPKGSTVTLHLV